MKSIVSGVLVKIAYADQLDVLLTKGSAGRPAARFNRQGQDALYLSVDEQSARVAMRKHVTEFDAPRVLVIYKISSCDLFDLRHPEAKLLRERASQDWQKAIRDGEEPESWKVADSLRQSNEVGLIDPSRSNPALWHVTLFRWNEPGAPTIEVVGQPMPITV